MPGAESHRIGAIAMMGLNLLPSLVVVRISQKIHARVPIGRLNLMGNPRQSESKMLAKRMERGITRNLLSKLDRVANLTYALDRVTVKRIG